MCGLGPRFTGSVHLLISLWNTGAPICNPTSRYLWTFLLISSTASTYISYKASALKSASFALACITCLRLLGRRTSSCQASSSWTWVWKISSQSGKESSMPSFRTLFCHTSLSNGGNVDKTMGITNCSSGSGYPVNSKSSIVHTTTRVFCLVCINLLAMQKQALAEHVAYKCSADTEASPEKAGPNNIMASRVSDTLVWTSSGRSTISYSGSTMALLTSVVPSSSVQSPITDESRSSASGPEGTAACRLTQNCAKQGSLSCPSTCFLYCLTEKRGDTWSLGRNSVTFFIVVLKWGAVKEGYTNRVQLNFSWAAILPFLSTTTCFTGKRISLSHKPACRRPTWRSGT